MAISALGAGSGLDLKALMTQLIAAERTPYDNRYNRQEADIQAKISAYGTLRGAVASLQSPLDRLSSFAPAQRVSVSDGEALSASLDGAMANGSFRVQINQLATAQSLATEADGTFASSSAVVVEAGSSASLSIQVGTGEAKTIALDASEDEDGLTLAEIRNAINEAAVGVTASIIKDGTEARLVLTADETGAANTIQMTATDTLFDEALTIDGVANGEITQVAQDAEVEINGIPVTSSSNTLDDAYEGVTLKLLEETTSAVTVTVSEDRSTLPALINEFLGAYNALIDQTNSLTAYDSKTRRASLLTGDSTIRGIVSSLRNAMSAEGGSYLSETDAITGAESYFRFTLPRLGIKTDATGKLTFDSGKLNTAINKYGAESVAEAINEIAGNLGNVASSYTDSIDGKLEARTKGLYASLDVINERRALLEKRIEEYGSRLSRDFSNLDTLLAQMNNTSNYLATHLDSLRNLSNRK